MIITFILHCTYLRTSKIIVTNEYYVTLTMQNFILNFLNCIYFIDWVSRAAGPLVSQLLSHPRAGSHSPFDGQTCGPQVIRARLLWLLGRCGVVWCGVVCCMIFLCVILCRRLVQYSAVLWSGACCILLICVRNLCEEMLKVNLFLFFYSFSSLFSATYFRTSSLYFLSFIFIFIIIFLLQLYFSHFHSSFLFLSISFSLQHLVHTYSLSYFSLSLPFFSFHIIPYNRDYFLSFESSSPSTNSPCPPLCSRISR
jgi:hypothetical protein